jgi:hypothetical protein
VTTLLPIRLALPDRIELSTSPYQGVLRRKSSLSRRERVGKRRHPERTGHRVAFIAAGGTAPERDDFSLKSSSRFNLSFEHDLFGKPASTHRVKPEGMLFRIVL